MDSRSTAAVHPSTQLKKPSVTGQMDLFQMLMAYQKSQVSVPLSHV